MKSEVKEKRGGREERETRSWRVQTAILSIEGQKSPTSEIMVRARITSESDQAKKR